MIEKKQEEFKFIKQVRINGFWKSENSSISWILNPDVNILAGDNGTGKSTVLQLIIGTIRQEFKRPFLCDLYNIIGISFNDFLPEKVTASKWNVFSSLSNEQTLEFISKDERFNDKFKIFIQEKAKKGVFISKNNIHLPDIHNNKKLPRIRIDEIKTVDSLLLDRETIQKLSNEEVLTDLDWKVSKLEIEYKDYQIDIGKRTINALKKGEKTDKVTKISETQTLFYDLIDQLFAHTKKTIDRESNDILFRDKENKEITPYRLSSGEKHMLIMLLTALVQDNKHAIMIMDEPEISLHTDWQKNLISNIRKLNPNVQLIIATHSPAIVMNGWQDKIFQIDDLIVKSEANKIEEINQESN